MGCGASVEANNDANPPTRQHSTRGSDKKTLQTFEMPKKKGQSSGLSLFVLKTGSGNLSVAAVKPDSLFDGIIEVDDELVSVNGTLAKDAWAIVGIILAGTDLTITGYFNKPIPPKEEILAKQVAKAESVFTAKSEFARRKAARDKIKKFTGTLVISEIKAFEVPDADKAGRSDPYIKFTLLNGDIDFDEEGRTPPVYNERNPVFAGAVQILLPQGSDAALTKKPKLKVEMFDKDLTDDDDPLGSAEFVLNVGSGSIEKGVIKGLEKLFADCHVSFKYEVKEEVAPAAKLQITNIKATGIPNTDAKNYKNNSAKADPFIWFQLLEVGNLNVSAQTTAMTTAKTDDSNPGWGGLTLTFDLPRGSCRPPMLLARIWDDDSSKDQLLSRRYFKGDPDSQDDDGIACNDFRVTEGLNEHSLIGYKGRVASVPLSFTATIYNE